MRASDQVGHERQKRACRFAERLITEGYGCSGESRPAPGRCETGTSSCRNARWGRSERSPDRWSRCWRPFSSAAGAGEHQRETLIRIVTTRGVGLRMVSWWSSGSSLEFSAGRGAGPVVATVHSPAVSVGEIRAGPCASCFRARPRPDSVRIAAPGVPRAQGPRGWTDHQRIGAGAPEGGLACLQAAPAIGAGPPTPPDRATRRKRTVPSVAIS